MKAPRIAATLLLVGALFFASLLPLARVQVSGDPVEPLQPAPAGLLVTVAGVALLAGILWPSRLDRFRVVPAGVAALALGATLALLAGAPSDGQPNAFGQSLFAVLLAGGGLWATLLRARASAEESAQASASASASASAESGSD